MNDRILAMLFKAKIAADDQQTVKKANEPVRTDMSKMKLSSSENSIANRNENLVTNSAGPDRLVNRAERRRMEKESQKKR
jgi:hypothetical protein